MNLRTEKKSILILFGVLLLINPLNSFAQEKYAMAGNNIAVFYPESFNVKSSLPSFALKEEPVEKGNLPSSFPLMVEFSSVFDKSLAFIDIDSNVSFYGTGENSGRLLRNGTTVKLWNFANGGYSSKGGINLYHSHPWVLGVRKNGSAFGILADVTYPTEFSLGEDVLISSEGPPFRVFIMEGASPQEVLQQLGMLTGTIGMPPLWSLGYHQSRWSYYPDSRVKEIADTFRLKKIPCDVIWMDIHYMDDYKVFTFSPEYFPNPAELNDYLHKKGFKSAWMIDPGVKLEPGYEVYDSGQELDVWVKDNAGSNYVGKVWPEKCVFPDFTQQKTRDWWADLYKPYMTLGVDGVWNDMNEPCVLDEPDLTMPKTNVHKGDSVIPKGLHERYHNVYGMLMTKASREGILEAKPNKRPFLLTRSSHLGGQRYAATWTGDNGANWNHLKVSIPMSINLGLSGQPFSGADIGGFNRNATPELFGHWIALGVFYPFCRAHTSHNTSNQEPWSFGPEIEEVSRVAIQRRYRLLPYIYTLFQEASVTGMPIMRPVFFADLETRWLRGEEEAFLFGRDILVIPKWAYKPAIPKGNWRSFSLVGEDSKNDPYQPDIRIREGAIIPTGKIIQNTTEYSLDTLTLYVSLNDQGYAEGRLYHDAGEGFGYQNGDYALMTFIAKKEKNQIFVKVSQKEGGYNSGIETLKVIFITDSGVIEHEGSIEKGITLNIND